VVAAAALEYSVPKDTLSGDLFAAAEPARVVKPAPAAPPARAVAPTADVAPSPAVPPARDDAPDLAPLAARLDASADYRVLRRFASRERYSPSLANPARALFIDLETTGLDSATDQIIELSAVPFTFGQDAGEVGVVERPYSSFEDPGRPIPETASKITGITDEMVRGKKLDDAAVRALLAKAELVISHNAAFDRPFLERRLPAFAKARWACSMADVDWKAAGYDSRGLGSLLTQHGREFFDAHRAELDCRVGIHILATPFESGERPLKQLLRRAAVTRTKVSAVGAPIDLKDLLKSRGYRWFPGDANRPKAWYRLIASDELAAEREWLTEKIYAGKYRASEEEEDLLRRFV
jgi:DNA polymerase-3 subunit epsilon